MEDLAQSSVSTAGAPQDAAWLVRQAYLATWEASRLRRQAEELAAKARRIEADNASLRASLSWKLSAPLRFVDEAWRGLKRTAFGKRRSAVDPFAWVQSYRLEKSDGPVLVDTSRIIHSRCSPGMRRVTQNIAKAIVRDGRCAGVPVDLRRGAIHDASRLFSEASGPDEPPRPLHRLSKLVMFDASYDIFERLVPLFESCAALEIPVVTCIHDLIPLDHPEAFPDGIPEDFRRWLDCAIRNSDAFICVSETTARRLESELRTRSPERPLQIGWWPLGTEIPETVSSQESRNFLFPPGPFCLCVGTLEPRKNHRFLVDAFSRWWRDESFPCDLVLAGSEGWKVEGLINAIENHPEFGRRLWWFRDASDPHLRTLYERCSAVLMPSTAEGFGLPVVEGARFNKPVVLSDILVFREIVARNGYYFNPRDEASLKTAVERAIEPAAEPTEVRTTSWKESAGALMELIARDAYQIRIG